MSFSPDEFRLLHDTIAMVTGAGDILVNNAPMMAELTGDWMTGQVIHVDGGWVLRP